eukprot:1236192-Prymnesium_polylepis.2
MAKVCVPRREHVGQHAAKVAQRLLYAALQNVHRLNGKVHAVDLKDVLYWHRPAPLPLDTVQHSLNQRLALPLDGRLAGKLANPLDAVGRQLAGTLKLIDPDVDRQVVGRRHHGAEQRVVAVVGVRGHKRGWNGAQRPSETAARSNVFRYLDLSNMGGVPRRVQVKKQEAAMEKELKKKDD